MYAKAEACGCVLYLPRRMNSASMSPRTKQAEEKASLNHCSSDVRYVLPLVCVSRVPELQNPPLTFSRLLQEAACQSSAQPRATLRDLFKQDLTWPLVVRAPFSPAVGFWQHILTRLTALFVLCVTCSWVVFACLVCEYLVMRRGRHGGAGGGGPNGAAAVLGGERGHVLLGHHLPGGGGQVGGCSGLHVRPPAGQPPFPAAPCARARAKVKIRPMQEHLWNY